MRPNIFDIATKELHQDAFIAWLLQWGEPNNKQFNESLNLCGQKFIQQLISTQHQQRISNISKVEVGRQWENIDVWAEVYTTEGNYLIIIEDKTFTSEHSDQLLKYRKSGEDFCLKNDFNLVSIYLKMGSEPEKDLKAIRSKGFSTFSRYDFINLLSDYKDIEDSIFRDFSDRLERLEAAYNAFETTNINNWNDHCWIGFYQFLEKEIGLVTWHYVNPPAGSGFWNACLNWEDWDGFPVYIQIEQGKLCFKIATHPDEINFEVEFNRNEKRNEWYRVLISQSQKAGIAEIRKPDRFGSGNYMTTAMVDRDIWLGNGEVIIDKAQVIDRLKKYKEFLELCLQ